MNSSPTPARHLPLRPVRRGFSLAEMLVVIAIIGLLFSVLMPVLNMVRRQGERTQVSAMLSSIGTALDSYRSDFGDFPRFSRDDTSFPNPLNAAPDRGARLLARALFGPAPAFDPRVPRPTTAGDIPGYQNDAKAAFQDGHGEPGNPFGLKESLAVIQRAGEAGVHYPGPVFEPYLDAERFELRRIGELPSTDNDDLVAADAAFTYGVDAVILDPLNRHPILYYPARPKQPDINDPSAGLFVNEFDQNAMQGSLYNSFDNRGLDDGSGNQWPGLSLDDPETNIQLRATNGQFSLRELLGDIDQNGAIDAGESAVTTAPYLLISGGIDGFQYDAANTFWYVTTPIANFDVSHTAQ